MQALTAYQLLSVWEAGQDQVPTKRAIALLAAAYPTATVESLNELSIGDRDSRLMRLREWAFGSRLLAIADCPNCGDRLETDFMVDDIVGEDTAEAAKPIKLDVEGYEVCFRMPNSSDLIAIAGTTDPEMIRQCIVQRCVIDARYQGEGVTAAPFPEKVVTAISQHMDRADPRADIQLELTCPSCNNHWNARFDIVSFFWNELGAWVKRVLQEVHVLASAYGWREHDILAMTPWRRRCYMEMLGT